MKKILYTDKEITLAVKESFSYSEVCRKLGLVPKGGNINTIKKKITLLNLDCGHFKSNGWSKGLTIIECPSLKRKSIDDILVENSSTKSSTVKNRLINDGIKEEKCEICGNTIWNGKKIPLEIHHINGNHTDNRLINLQIICPNCHAQTENFCSKNNVRYRTIFVHEKPIMNGVCKYCGSEFKKKISDQKFCSEECYYKSIRKSNVEITSDLLINKFIDLKSFVKVGEYFGMSDKGICKWYKKFGLPNTKKELLEYINNI